MTANCAEPIGDEEARSLLGTALDPGPVLIAVSGGPDSVALMRLCASLARRIGALLPHATTVDHGLRPASAEEARQAGMWATECGLSHTVLTWDGQKPATGLQEKARAARYGLLTRHARRVGATALLTAHTLDDQAETVLMRLARGSGLAGLAGMRAVSRRDGLVHRRPLLGIAKARLLATCAANGWPYVEDPSNADPRFARARWRSLRPALEDAGLTAPRLARLAGRLARAEDALEEKAAQALAAVRVERGGSGLVIDLAALAAREPREIVLRALLGALAETADRGEAPPVRLDRAETALAAIEAAGAAGRALTRTLAGTVLAFDGERFLSLRREGPRRRGWRAVPDAPLPVRPSNLMRACRWPDGPNGAMS